MRENQLYAWGFVRDDGIEQCWDAGGCGHRAGRALDYIHIRSERGEGGMWARGGCGYGYGAAWECRIYACDVLRQLGQHEDAGGQV